MREYFDFVFKNYNTLPLKVDKTHPVYQTIVGKIPESLKTSLNRSDLLFNGSVGKGYRTTHPWVSILNKNITRSTQEGLYIVYLFRSDMKGVYLTLSQGVTQFERKYQGKKYTYLQKVSAYFQNEFKELKSDFLANVDLVSKKGTLGYGYERSIIFAKYYDADLIDQYNLYEDLQRLIDIYDEVYHHMSHQTYDQTITDILSDQSYTLNADQAISQIDLVLRENASYPRTDHKSITKVEKQEAKSPRLKKISDPIPSKLDYLKKASQDAYTGLEGEKLILEYESERLKALGLHEKLAELDWVSLYNDVAGYDIKSFDLDDKGQITDLYIEVKTTVSKLDTDLYVSKNEYETSQRHGQNYAIYRVYDVLNITPKFYIAKGPIEDNFFLEPSTYKATYKWKVY
jgi:hypothetical protein